MRNEMKAQTKRTERKNKFTQIDTLVVMGNRHRKQAATTTTII